MKFSLLRKLWPETLRSKSSVALIVTAAVLVELTAGIQYWYAREEIKEEMQHRAETELRVKNLEIQKVMIAVETAVGNLVWAVEKRLRQPDSLYVETRRLVENNPTIVGVGAAFIANYYPEKGRWFEPYVARRENNRIEVSQIGNSNHNYLESHWFIDGISAGHGSWSEPYYDEAGARMMLCTYTHPIHDVTGNIVGLVGADVSLDWLSDTLNANHIYPTSYNVLISRTGQLMVCPEESLVMRGNIQDVAARLEDTTAHYINREMMGGRKGKASVINAQGEKDYVFFAPLHGETGWSMAVVCPDKEIFHNLRKIGFNLFLLLLVGLALMGYIIWRSFLSANRLAAAQIQKSKLENQIQIASGIQMALLPKIFPPYPDRDDVDVHATLTPAKAVGGDLYDFHIRDEKLFFCIGDVSGKGVPASLVMAITRTLFRNVISNESRPHRIVSAISDTLSEDNPNDVFVTFFAGVLDLPSGRLRYSNAGHEAPYIIGEKVEQLPCDSNLPLGTYKGWKYSEQEMFIKPGSTIFLYTDGLTEAEDSTHQMFGKRRLLSNLVDHITTSSDRNANALIDHILAAVHKYVDGAERSDDLTMMAIRYTKEQETFRLERTLTLPSNVQIVPQLNIFVDEICESLGFTPKVTMQMNLAVEEAVVNVMKYAYPSATKGEVTIEAHADNETLKFTITDHGIPFDPTTFEEVDTTLSTEERPIGGLGIHLIRKMMDSINYNRIDDQNVLTLIKRL